MTAATGEHVLIEILDSHGRVHLRERVALPAERQAFTIGRSVRADVTLDDPHAAAMHATVEVTPDGTLRVSDHDSVNGVVINGKRHRNASHIEVPDGLLQIGRTRLRIRHCARNPGRGKARQPAPGVDPARPGMARRPRRRCRPHAGGLHDVARCAARPGDDTRHDADFRGGGSRRMGGVLGIVVAHAVRRMALAAACSNFSRRRRRVFCDQRHPRAGLVRFFAAAVEQPCRCGWARSRWAARCICT